MRSNLLIVSPDRYARFGHQTMSILTGIFLSKITGYKLLLPRYMYFCDKWNQYVHWERSQFVTSSINSQYQVVYLERDQADGVGNRKWNVKDISQVAYLVELLKSYPENYIINLPFDQLPGRLVSYGYMQTIQEDLNSIFQDLVSKGNSNEEYICIHIRRGDVNPSQSTKKKYVNDIFYMELIRCICLKYDQSIPIYICTQGDVSWLEKTIKNAESKGRKVIINTTSQNFINDNEIDDFATMCNASYLFSAGSSFSELASFIGKPKKLFNISYSNISSNLMSVPIHPAKDLQSLIGLI